MDLGRERLGLAEHQWVPSIGKEIEDVQTTAQVHA